ncbi:MAG: TPM domain-containing protein [Actinomycetota bacterium]
MIGGTRGRGPRRAWALLGLLAALAACRGAAEPSLPPTPTQFVTDRAGVLSAQREDALNRKLEAFGQETSNQVVVWIDRRIPEGWDLESFAADAFEAWGIGQKQRDNGILFVVFTQDRRARIEVGYGLEGALPDALASRVLNEQAIPRFQQNDYAAGIEGGVTGVIAATRGEYTGTGGTQGGGEPRGDEVSPWAIFVPLGFAGFLLFGLLRGMRRRVRRFTYGPGWWWGGGWGGGGFGGGGGWSGGGGFSGGGGSSGGGGASGGW